MDQQANKISEVSYVELQNRFMQASTVHLCPTMDIVAVILHNNQLVVLRIFTWCVELITTVIKCFLRLYYYLQGACSDR